MVPGCVHVLNSRILIKDQRKFFIFITTRVLRILPVYPVPGYYYHGISLATGRDM